MHYRYEKLEGLVDEISREEDYVAPFFGYIKRL